VESVGASPLGSTAGASTVTARLKQLVGWQKACVALGHKHARIVWAMLARGRPFDAKHLSSFLAPPGAPAVMTAVTTA